MCVCVCVCVWCHASSAVPYRIQVIVLYYAGLYCTQTARRNAAEFCPPPPPPPKKQPKTLAGQKDHPKRRSGSRRWDRSRAVENKERGDGDPTHPPSPSEVKRPLLRPYGTITITITITSGGGGGGGGDLQGYTLLADSIRRSHRGCVDAYPRSIFLRSFTRAGIIFEISRCTSPKHVPVFSFRFAWCLKSLITVKRNNVF